MRQPHRPYLLDGPLLQSSSCRIILWHVHSKCLVWSSTGALGLFRHVYALILTNILWYMVNYRICSYLGCSKMSKCLIFCNYVLIAWSWVGILQTMHAHITHDACVREPPSCFSLIFWVQNIYYLLVLPTGSKGALLVPVIWSDSRELPLVPT